MSEIEEFDVVVIGAGLAGLTAAHSLRERGWNVAVFEREPDIGGRARTLLVDEYPLDIGAQFVSSFYRTTLRLIDEIGISSALVRRSQTAYIVRDRAEHELWPIRPLVSSRALTLPGKVRMMALVPALARYWRDLEIDDLARSTHMDTLSSADFLRPRIGDEALRYFISPLLRGLLYWEAESTSAPVVLSILKAFMTGRGTYRVDGGMGVISYELARDVIVNRETEVVEVAQDGPRYRVRALSHGASRTVVASAVICATTASVARRLLPWIPGPMVKFLDSVSYSQTTTLYFRAQVPPRHYPRGAILFPAPDAPDLSSINPGYAETTQAGANASTRRQVSVSLSDGGARRYTHLDDSDLVTTVAGIVSSVIGRRTWISDADLVHVQRWHEALPRFDVGHIRGTNDFLSRSRRLDGVAFAGDYLGGPYIDGAIRSGRAAAEQILAPKRLQGAPSRAS